MSFHNFFSKLGSWPAEWRSEVDIRQKNFLPRFGFGTKELAFNFANVLDKWYWNFEITRFCFDFSGTCPDSDGSWQLSTRGSLSLSPSAQGSWLLSVHDSTKLYLQVWLILTILILASKFHVVNWIGTQNYAILSGWRGARPIFFLRSDEWRKTSKAKEILQCTNKF